MFQKIQSLSNSANKVIWEVLWTQFANLLMWKLTIWMCLVIQKNAVLSVWVRNLLYNGPTNVNGLFSMKAAQTNGFEENWTKKEKSVVLTVNNWSQQTPYNSKFTTQTKWRAKMALSRKMGLRYLTRKVQATMVRHLSEGANIFRDPQVVFSSLNLTNQKPGKLKCVLDLRKKDGSSKVTFLIK